MSPRPGKSLKSRNLPWLVSLVACDILILVALVFPDLLQVMPFPQLAIARAAISLVVPVAVLLLSGLISHGVKASLVFWKLTDALPGHRAFTKYGPSDVRVDMIALEKNIGPLPTAPADQNRLWFRLYKEVETDASVSEAHKSYLLYRDMAAISVALLIGVPICFLLARLSPSVVWKAAGVFMAQYLIAATAARHSGARLVGGVLAIHATRRSTAAQTSPKTRKTPVRASTI
jgi:hypothetical protein